MKKSRKKKNTVIRIAAMCILSFAVCFFFLNSYAAAKEPTLTYQSETARPSVNGRLHVQGTVLADKNGTPVQLRGVSSHGLTWYPEFISEDFIRSISDDWNCNLIRLAMYSDIYCSDEKDRSLELMLQGIDAAISADMYVLVDWHILSECDPNVNKEEAKAFFSLRL